MGETLERIVTRGKVFLPVKESSDRGPSDSVGASWVPDGRKVTARSTCIEILIPTSTNAGGIYVSDLTKRCSRVY